jgi:hypothetical protein
VAGPFEHGNELYDSIKCWEVLEISSTIGGFSRKDHLHE